MLNYNELENIARFKKLSLPNSEKDYLQDIILFSIYSYAGRDLVFKDGTCLYKVYKLNRFSEDLDFTTKKIDAKKLADKIVKDLALLNIKSKVKELQVYRDEINIRLLINGPLYKGSKETQCFIPLNISMKEQVVLEPKKELVFSLYKEVPSFEVFAMQEEEILAEKVRAIMTRNKARDIYDLWFLLEKNIDFDSELVNNKLVLYNLKFNMNEFKNKIEKMKGFWQADLKNLMLQEIEFGEVKARIFDKLDNRNNNKK